jgi:hypothetical protein
MAIVLLDDHLLRDWLAGPDTALKRAVARSEIATTNLWYARLCNRGDERMDHRLRHLRALCLG